MPKLVSDPEEFKTILKDNQKVVCDFFAEWCGPCKMIAPSIDKIEAATQGAVFIKVDCDTRAMAAIVQQYKVEGLPTFSYFYNGEELNDLRVVGANLKGIASSVKALLDK